MISYGIKIDLIDGVTDMVKGIMGEFKGLGRVVNTTKSNIDKLRKISSDIKSYKQLQQQIKKTSKSIDTQREFIANLNRELVESDGLTAAQMKKKQAQINRAVVALEKLEDKQTDYNRQLDESGQRLRKAGVDTDNLASEQRRLNQEIQKTTTQLAKQKGRWNVFKGVARDLQKVRNEMTGIVASVVAVAGMGMSVQAALEPALNFEVAMDKVQALTRLDIGQSDQLKLFTELEKQSLSLGRSTTYSATQVADAQGFLAMAGFDAKKVVTAIPGILDLSKAAGTELATTANIGSNILSGFRLQADQMGKVGDVLAATFTRSNVDLRMLGESMKYAAPIAAELKIGLEDTAAMAGLLGNVGIQGSEAGTALRALYNRLAAPPRDAEKSLKTLAIKTKDANGNMRSTSMILGEIAKKTEKMGDATRLGHFKAIAGMEAGSAMATLVAEQGAKGITKFVEILKDSEGEASRIAEIMGDNTANKIKAVDSAVEGLSISVGKVLKPTIDPLIDDVKDLVNGITDWTEANPELMAKIVNLSLGIGTLIAGITTLGVVAGLVKIAMIGIGSVLAVLLSPITLIVAGITALGGAWYFWEDIMSWLEGSFPKVHEFFSIDMPNIIGKTVQAMRTILPFGGLIGSVYDRITQEGLSFKSIFGGIMDWVKEKMDWVKTSLDWIGEGLKKIGFKADKEKLSVDISEFADISGEVTTVSPSSGKKQEGGFWSNLFGGGREKGGSVTAGKFYEVNESGPELFNMGSKTFLMPNASGTVIPLRQPEVTIPQMRAEQAQHNITTQHESKSRLDIHIDSPVPARVERMESEGMEITVNTGPMGVFSA